MKNKKVSVKTILIIVLIGIMISLILILINNQNTNIAKQETSKEQLTETTSSNAYVDMATHLSEITEASNPTIEFVSSTNIANNGTWTGNTDYKAFIVTCVRDRVDFSRASASNCSVSGKSISAPSTQDTYAYGKVYLVSNITGTPKMTFSSNGADRIYIVTYGIK